MGEDLPHRRGMKTEEKAKVVASVVFNSLPANIKSRVWTNKSMHAQIHCGNMITIYIDIDLVVLK